jgi:two-component system CheB/CheR fusion protein
MVKDYIVVHVQGKRSAFVRKRQKPEPESGVVQPVSPAEGLFPIVGIGASAGGLEAIELFLGHVPKESGMAFVIVQHLDPTRKGILPELLQRATPMRVSLVKDRTRIQPDCVYVIPPNRDMSVLHGILHLLEPASPRGLRYPIDFFLRSLADDHTDRSVAVILSGMGSDGTLGIKAIKERGGAVVVQDPSTAKFDSMPRSAVDSGVVDVVAPVAELPGKIIELLKRVPLLRSGPELEDKAQSAIEKIYILLRAHTGHDFSLYKSSTVYRRIERRMSIHRINRIIDYVRFLQENPQELDLLFKELLIGVTHFFRDPDAWEQLKREALPALLDGRRTGRALRAWSPGCSTGEEAYSLAIAFREAVEALGPVPAPTLQIFATDLDEEAIAKARQGVYPVNITADVSPERLRRFFVKEGHGYRVCKEIRKMVIFAPQNMVMDPPFTKLDLLVCRNLLIYLTSKLQKKLIPLFHYSLNPGGVLFLGSAESTGTFVSLFAPLKGKSRLYRRLESPFRGESPEFPSSFSTALPGMAEQPRADKSAPNLQSMAEQLLLQRYSPAAVLVSGNGDILFISGRTGKYLELAAGKANWNIFVMVRPGLRHELNTAFDKVVRKRNTITLPGLKVEAEGRCQCVDVTVQALDEPEALRGMVMIVFKEGAIPPETEVPKKSGRRAAGSPRLAQVQIEFQQAREALQTLRDEMQTSQEELKSTNEEFQSTNEELQSTNEELTTSKEEMQSMNEELQTVNHEQQIRMDELAQASSDMKNLLNSTDIATVFLDNALCLRRFTTQATKIINLIPTDVGRPITDITSSLLYTDLSRGAQEVLE